VQILHQQTGIEAVDNLILSTIEASADKVRRAALESTCYRVGKRNGFDLVCRLPQGEALFD
jgi:hypothetical protein